MLKIDEFEEILDISSRIASVLDFPGYEGMPPDVTEAVRAAKKQMEDLPSLIEDINLAYNRYATLSRTLNRMTELAFVASKDNGPSDKEREIMDGEFGELAHVIAREAGQTHFPGTSLSLERPGTAKAAYRVLSYLAPVVEALDHEIKGQKSMVIEALAETINFVSIVARCYPEAKGVEKLRGTLERIKLPKSIYDPIEMSPTIH
jgi:Asp-tRNA(Asn)/Glu-tRNA(Gln) amidotransferase A subunit family amidase